MKKPKWSVWFYGVFGFSEMATFDDFEEATRYSKYLKDFDFYTVKPYQEPIPPLHNPPIPEEYKHAY